MTCTRPSLALRLLVPGALAALGGCSVISPAPTLELLKMVGTTASLALSTQPPEASHTVVQAHAAPRLVCIAVVPATTVVDLLPALQRELGQHAVASRLVPAGDQRPGCGHWLEYTAAAEWEHRPWGSDPMLVLSQATLTLRDSGGRVLAHSRYEVGQGMLTSKWVSTQEKLAPVVSALLSVPAP